MKVATFKTKFYSRNKHFWKYLDFTQKYKFFKYQFQGIMVELKFKFLQNISHYYNNKFAFHIHIFIIFVLSFNKLNTIIHSNIRFMVIVYNQNLHFRIHCKKLQKQYYNSFHHNLPLSKIHTKDENKIHYKSMCLSILLKT